MKKYDHKIIEKKWQKKWASSRIYTAKEKGKKKKFVLDMFPYPSGEGLHVGHPKGYIATDVYSRMMRMKGYSVLHPMGWDAFGLPAENFAIKNKIHPERAVKKNIARFKEQLKLIGLDYDWSREINTTDPNYYKWTQWIFLQLLRKGLAYQSYEAINWCPTCQTGLSNEDLEGNACERCGTVVEKRPMRQWVLKITDYAERLLKDLDLLPEWQEHIKESQRNWIGKSEGAEIRFMLTDDSEQLTESVKVFTTRADTLFGVTFLVLSPEHPLVKQFCANQTCTNTNEVEDYVKSASQKSEIERVAEGREKTGVKLEGVWAINPGTNDKIPVFVADYILANYGTGAIMGVPAHDERDYAFARKHGIQRTQVISHVVHNTEGAYKVRLDVPFKDRDAVMCIIKHWEKNEYLCIEWKDYSGIRSMISGGIEAAEDVVAAGKREILEESGYKSATFKRQVGGFSYIEFYHQRKQTNVRARFRYLYFELESGEQVPVAEHESAQHKLVWKKPDEVVDFLTISEKEKIWKWFSGEEYFYTGEGRLVNSGVYDGMTSEEAREKIIAAFGERKTTYKLRDWIFSRQRYWGEPIPVIHCERCGVVPVPEKDLPVTLPPVKNYAPTGTGESPLAAIEKWVNVKCPSCAHKEKETKYLIFDFDGVLGDTYKVNLEARIQMGEAKDMDESIQKMNEYFSRKPSHSRGDHMTSERLDRYHDWSYRFAVEAAKIKYKMFEGFIKEIKKIKKVKVAVVSAGYDLYSIGPLKKSGLKYTHFLAGNHDHSKENKIEKVCKAWNVDVKDVYYFTDTQADVYELENLLDRRKIIGCAWGYQGEQKLREVLPAEQVLKKFSDIHALWKPCIGKRETNTMPQWAGSSWYYLRYMDPKNKKSLVDKKKERYWAPVDLYVGGAEHATRHLIYARFWHKFLYDQKLVSTKEPFTRLISVGLIQAEDGRKMSKRYGNVVNPDDVIATYGADTLRVYEMFMGPFTDSIAWNTNSMIGARRFLERVWALSERVDSKDNKELDAQLHRTIKKVTEDIEAFKFNTAISQMMIFVNEAIGKSIGTKQWCAFLQILAPFAPHMAEELWAQSKGRSSVHVSPWPQYDRKKVVEKMVSIAIQVNGKTRGVVSVSPDAPEADVKSLARELEPVKNHLEGKEIRKTIYVPGRILNFVV